MDHDSLRGQRGELQHRRGNTHLFKQIASTVDNLRLSGEVIHALNITIQFDHAFYSIQISQQICGPCVASIIRTIGGRGGAGVKNAGENKETPGTSLGRQRDQSVLKPLLKWQQPSKSTMMVGINFG